MRILLDESLPRQLAGELTGHSVRTVVEMGWSSRTNGVLLRIASEQFDVLLTADRNIEFQQNITRARIGVIVLSAFNNRIESLRPLIPRVLEALEKIRPGLLIQVT